MKKALETPFSSNSLQNNSQKEFQKSCSFLLSSTHSSRLLRLIEGFELNADSATADSIKGNIQSKKMDVPIKI